LGEIANSFLGYSVSGAGDVNHDGIDDIIIGAPNAALTAGRTLAGAAYVIYGKQGLLTIDLATLTNLQGFRIKGALAGEAIGESVSNVGDVNKDNIDDVIVGGNGADFAYIIYGGSSGMTDLDLARDLPAEKRGYRIKDVTSNDYIGLSVSNFGDANGDGVNEILVGGYTTSRESTIDFAVAYLIYGCSFGCPSPQVSESSDSKIGIIIGIVAGVAAVSIIGGGAFYVIKIRPKKNKNITECITFKRGGQNDL
jgi:hypothetical protein